MSTQEKTPTNNLQKLSRTYVKDQYTLWQILGIWLAGGAPIWLLSWVAYPALSAGLTPVDAGLFRMKLLLAGVTWQFVLAMIILYREEGNIRLGTISRRFWLNHPVSARTGETKRIPQVLAGDFKDMWEGRESSDLMRSILKTVAKEGTLPARKLEKFKKQGGEFQKTMDFILRRDILIEENGAYRFRAGLLRRWIDRQA